MPASRPCAAPAARSLAPLLPPRPPPPERPPLRTPSPRRLPAPRVSPASPRPGTQPPPPPRPAGPASPAGILQPGTQDGVPERPDSLRSPRILAAPPPSWTPGPGWGVDGPAPPRPCLSLGPSSPLLSLSSHSLGPPCCLPIPPNFNPCAAPPFLPRPSSIGRFLSCQTGVRRSYWATPWPRGRTAGPKEVGNPSWSRPGMQLLLGFGLGWGSADTSPHR